MMTIYGLESQGEEVDAAVFSEKLKKVISALKKLDSFYNTRGQHKFMIADLEFSSASVWLREKAMKPKVVRQSPAVKFAQIGYAASSGGAYLVENAADEFALDAYVSLSKGSGKSFSYGIIEAPDVATVRLDRLLEKRVRGIIDDASSAAEKAPPRYFKGTAIETYDGTMKLVDLRGLFPEAKLILSAGGKEISCIVPAKDVDMLRNSLGRRALVTGRAQHDGRSMLPERIDVTHIRTVAASGNVISLQGAFVGAKADPMREIG
tara:strand:- start:1049 stop:1840 length:792 start_codon:yes stop_codon:yes gene_type:complete